MLAVALGVVGLGAVVVAGLQVRRVVGGLQTGVRNTSGRLRPLLDELQAEAAVTATEVEAVQASVARLQDSRRDAKRRSRPLPRPGRSPGRSRRRAR